MALLFVSLLHVDITAAPANGAESREVHTIEAVPKMAHMEGRTVLFHGTVAEFRSSWRETAPNIIYFRDGAHEIEVIYWTNGAIPVEIPNFSQPGTPVYAEGVVNWYRGRLQITVDDLTRLSTQPLPERNGATERHTGNSPTTAQASNVRQRLQFERYSPLGVERELRRRETALVYLRSQENPRSLQVDNQYMLHPDAVRLIGDRPVFFVNVDTDEGKAWAQQLNVYRIPTLLLLNRDGEVSRLTFRDDTQPREVYQYMADLPQPE